MFSRHRVFERVLVAGVNDSHAEKGSIKHYPVNEQERVEVTRRPSVGGGEGRGRSIIARVEFG